MVGIVWVDPPAAGVAGQGAKVALRFVAEQAEPQSALALKRAVTGTGVAPRPAEEADDVALEVDLRGWLLRRVQRGRLHHNHGNDEDGGADRHVVDSNGRRLPLPFH